MHTVSRKSLPVWLGANLFGGVLFLGLGSMLWPDLGLEHCAPDFGDGLHFMIYGPALLLILLAALSAIVVAILEWRGDLRLIRVVAATLFVWVVIVTYDVYKTYRIVSPQCPIASTGSPRSLTNVSSDLRGVSSLSQGGSR
jgi:hypothetical protein